MASDIPAWVEQPWQNPTEDTLLPWTPYSSQNEDDRMGYWGKVAWQEIQSVVIGVKLEKKGILQQNLSGIDTDSGIVICRN